MPLFSRKPLIRVHLVIKGRIGDGWLDVDRHLKLAKGSTLSDLLDEADRQSIPLRHAIEQSPHLAETLMWNGERRVVAENLNRRLDDGDQIYLLSPVAGG